MIRAAGLVLAGGAGLRLGADGPKPLVALGDRRLIDAALDALAAHCAPVLVSANDAGAFAMLERPVVPDLRPDRAGPLAGLEAAAAFLHDACSDCTHLLAVPGDTPFLPSDLAARFLDGAGRTVRVARHGKRLHPTVALWPLATLELLAALLDDPHASRSVLSFLDRMGFAAVDFPDAPGVPGGDPFFNVNTPDDLALARRHSP